MLFMGEANTLHNDDISQRIPYALIEGLIIFFTLGTANPSEYSFSRLCNRLVSGSDCPKLSPSSKLSVSNILCMIESHKSRLKKCATFSLHVSLLRYVPS